MIIKTWNEPLINTRMLKGINVNRTPSAWVNFRIPGIPAHVMQLVLSTVL